MTDKLWSIGREKISDILITGADGRERRKTCWCCDFPFRSLWKIFLWQSKHFLITYLVQPYIKETTNQSISSKTHNQHNKPTWNKALATYCSLASGSIFSSFFLIKFQNFLSLGVFFNSNSNRAWKNDVILNQRHTWNNDHILLN